MQEVSTDRFIDIPEEVRKAVEFVLVEKIDEVLEHALEPKPVVEPEAATPPEEFPVEMPQAVGEKEEQ
jgi:hypothetical protein